MRAYLALLCGLLGCTLLPNRLLAQEVTATTSAVANFKIGNNSFNVYSVLTNATSLVEQWQFRYEPLLLPEFNSDGELATILRQSGDEWTVTFKMHIGDPEANKLAFKSLIEAYPNNAGKIKESNVSQLRLDAITFSFNPPIPQELGRLAIGPLHLGASPTVQFVLTSPTQDSAKKLEAFLRNPQVTLNCDYKYNTRATRRGAVAISMKDLRGTKLEVALNGMPSKDDGIVYVRRHDLRRLAENIHREMTINEIFEDPSLLDNDIVKTLLDRWNRQVNFDIQHLNEQKLKATFNAQDLAPDKITKQVNDWFRKVQSKDEYQASKHILAEAGVNIGIYGGSAKADISLSEHQLKEFLEINGYHVEFEGEKIVPKSIDLQQVNTADFDADFQVTQTKVYVGDNIIKSQNTDIQLQQVVADKAALPDLAGRLARLERDAASGFEGLRSNTAELQSRSGNAESRIETLLKALEKLDKDSLKYKRIEFVIAPAGKALGADEVQAPYAPQIGSHDILIPEAKELIAVWQTPIDSIMAQRSWSRIDPRIYQSPLRVVLGVTAIQPGERMRIVVHVLYR